MIELIEERIDRSLYFLGSFWHEVSGSPGPRQYDQQQTQLKELYHLSKNEAHQIKNLKKRIKLSNAELKTLIGQARAERDHITNELNKELNITEISAHLDVLHLKAQSIIDIANKENAQTSAPNHQCECSPPTPPYSGNTQIHKALNRKGIRTYENGKAGYIFDNLTRYI